MTRFLVLLIFIGVGPFVQLSSNLSCASGGEPDLVIYTYDTFVAPEGLGPTILPLFEKKCGCRIQALPSGDGVQILTRLQLDAKRGKRVAHLVVGIDQQLWERAKPWLSEWQGWEPKGYHSLIPQAKIQNGFLPYDYGIFAFMADRTLLAELKLDSPIQLQDLLKPQWKRNLILQDPRTSTPGLAFLLYTQKAIGEQVWDFWKVLRGQWLTLTPGWSGAYGLFLKKEAPLVWSYTTSQAYHEKKGDLPGPKRRYQALLFKEGQPYQIEGAAWVKGALQTQREKELARQFLEFLISPEVQKMIPETNWMLPVLKPIKLPQTYKNLPHPIRLVPVGIKAQEVENSLNQWSRIFY